MKVQRPVIVSFIRLLPTGHQLSFISFIFEHMIHSFILFQMRCQFLPAYPLSVSASQKPPDKDVPPALPSIITDWVRCFRMSPESESSRFQVAL